MPALTINTANVNVNQTRTTTGFSLFLNYILSVDRVRRCYTCNFIARFCRTSLSGDRDAVRNCACRTLQLCRINKNWPISVHRILATKLQRIQLFKSCATCSVSLQVTCDFVVQ